MENTYMKSYGMLQTVVDGNIVDDKKWNMIYDGDNLNLEAQSNNDLVYAQLNNEELLKLFQAPSYYDTIDKRLQNDLKNNQIKFKPVIIEEENVTTDEERNSQKMKQKKNKRCPNGTRRNKKNEICESKGLIERKTMKKSSSLKKSSSSNKKSKNITPDFLKTIY